MRIRLALAGPRAMVEAELDRLGYLYEVTALPGGSSMDRSDQYVARVTLTPRCGEGGEALVPVRIGDALLAADALRVMAEVGADVDPQRSAVLAAAAARVTPDRTTPETTTLPAPPTRRESSPHIPEGITQ
ncbi:hypothetical protein ACLQ2R_03370 [Streptosporangium sp. DT93]|uniref:hypothetical protein n=1 Tax=Streptosporangium sp. DT93 TaxID=3393428 RepID=UPI003CF546FC